MCVLFDKSKIKSTNIDKSNFCSTILLPIEIKVEDMDPYIEAQKRLDRGETKCTIDTRLSADASKQCSQYMSTDLREVKEQILTMRQAQRLTGKLSALAEERAALSPAGVIVNRRVMPLTGSATTAINEWQ